MLVVDQQNVASEVRGLLLQVVFGRLVLQIRLDPGQVDARLDVGLVLRDPDVGRIFGRLRGAAEGKQRRAG